MVSYATRATSSTGKTLLSFTYPQKIDMDYYSKRKYRLSIKFMNKDKKVRFKTIYFGMLGQPNLVDDGKYSKRKKVTDDLFHPSFWESKLLNTYKTLPQAFIKLVDEILPKQSIKIGKQQQKSSENDQKQQ